MLKKIMPFLISVVIATVFSALFAMATLSKCVKQLTFSQEYFFLCFKAVDNAVSASSLSETVNSLGGAGYILEYRQSFYIVISCYYDEQSALNVKNNLSSKLIDCILLNAKRSDSEVKPSEYSQFYGNLNTLNELSKVAYACANSLDANECSQNNAKSVLSDISSNLSWLLKNNSGNKFESELRRLLAECELADDDFILSRSLRKLQAAIIDTVLNI